MGHSYKTRGTRAELQSGDMDFRYIGERSDAWFSLAVAPVAYRFMTVSKILAHL